MGNTIFYTNITILNNRIKICRFTKINCKMLLFCNGKTMLVRKFKLYKIFTWHFLIQLKMEYYKNTMQNNN